MSLAERINRGEREPQNSEYLFYNPEQNITPEMRRWLAGAHVVHIAPLWLPLPRDGQKYGGTEAVVNNHIGALDKFGVGHQTIFGNPRNAGMERAFRSVRVITPKGFDPSTDYYEILQKDRERAYELEREYVTQAYEQILDEKDGITVVHDHTSFDRRQGLEAANHLTVVRTEHGPLTWPNTSHEEDAALREFIGQDKLGFIAISENQKSYMPELNWVGVNYNGVEPQEFIFNPNKKRSYVATLSRVTKDKGIHNAIEIARRAGIQLKIAGRVEGTPESYKYYEEKVEPHIDGVHVVHLKGGVNPEERKELLANAQALLMPIEWDEPFGMNMAEALMSGTPTLGVQRGSIPELIKHGETGYIARDKDDAVKGLKKIMNGDFDPAACRRRAETLFSSVAMTGGYTKIYMEEVARRENRN